MSRNKNDIMIGDLVKIKKQFLYPNQDVLILPYDKDSIGLVIKIENSKYPYDVGRGLNSTISFDYRITVKWSQADTFCSDDNHLHSEYELEIISKA
jgi:hypothetical protein